MIFLRWTICSQQSLAFPAQNPIFSATCVFGHFCLICICIYACSWVTPWPDLSLLGQKCFLWVPLQQYPWKKSRSRLIMSPHILSLQDMAAKTGQTAFCTFGTFSFFFQNVSGHTTGVECSCTDFSAEIGNLKSLSLFFDHFCLFFLQLGYRPILHILRPPPMGDPSSPMTPNRTLISPEPIQPIEDANWIHQWL